MSSTEEQQASGIKRTDLQQHDLSIPGREVVYFSRGAVEVAGRLVGDHSLLAVHHMELPGWTAG